MAESYQRRLTVPMAAELLRRLLPDENWEDEHLRRTPERFVQMLHELTDRTPHEFDFTIFPNDGIDEMVVVQDIPFRSLCAHHLLPFIGVAHIAYIPDKKVAGLSKLPRTVQYWSAGLWSQERLTEKITRYLEEMLEPVGVAVVMKAEHMCMSLRGAQAHGTKTTTSKMLGVFLDPSRGARQEFLNLISH